MATEIEAAQIAQSAENAIEGDEGKSTLPMRKRKKPDGESDNDAASGSEASNKLTTEEMQVKSSKEGQDGEAPPTAEGDDSSAKGLSRPPMSKAREIRLEQNRKAARESRRRKKVMIEELQRSVIFFSRANGTLKQQNDELSRLLMQAQSQIQAIESGSQGAAPAPAGQQQGADQSQQQAKQDNAEQAAGAGAQAPGNSGDSNGQQNGQYMSNISQQAQAQAVATQAMYESQGFPAAAARSAAQTMNASANQNGGSNAPAPANPNGMPGTPQTGSTMQAMANFQQAAAAAMQAAMAMTPGSAPPSGVAGGPSGAPVSYSEAMTSFAMQQAAASGQVPFGMPVMGQPPFMGHPGMGNPAAMSWQQQQQQGQPGAPGAPSAQPPASAGAQ